MAVGFIKQGRMYKMSGAEYYDKWRLSKIQYGADYIIEQESGFQQKKISRALTFSGST